MKSNSIALKAFLASVAFVAVAASTGPSALAGDYVGRVSVEPGYKVDLYDVRGTKHGIKTKSSELTQGAATLRMQDSYMEFSQGPRHSKTLIRIPLPKGGYPRDNSFNFTLTNDQTGQPVHIVAHTVRTYIDTTEDTHSSTCTYRCHDRQNGGYENCDGHKYTTDVYNVYRQDMTMSFKAPRVGRRPVLVGEFETRRQDFLDLVSSHSSSCH